MIMLHVAKDSFTSFQIWMSFIFLARVYQSEPGSRVLSRSSESRHSYPVSDLGGKGEDVRQWGNIKSFTIKYYATCIRLKNFPFISSSL